MKVAVYGVKSSKGYGRDKQNLIGMALINGFKRHGIPCERHDVFNGEVEADVALAYGWINELSTQLFSTYKKAGKHFIFVDLGYWDRGAEGHYRVGIDDWDTALMMRRGCPSDRFDSLKVDLRDNWARDSKRIMVVGMSGKAAWTHGYSDGQWEQQTRAALIEQLPGYEIYVRQKPNKLSHRMPSIEEDLRDCRFVVSHHSNVAVDALVAGVPFWAKKGVGSLICPKEFTPDLVEAPFFPPQEDKMQFLYDVAYAQWTPNEMRSGRCWEYIKGVLAI